MVAKFGYWRGRGIVTPIRMLLAYGDVQCEFIDYLSLIHEPVDNRWYSKDKTGLATTLDFPNLPYYIDDEVQLTQSKVIMQYLGRKFGLESTNDAEALRMSLIIEQAVDMLHLMDYAGDIYDSVANRAEVHEALKKEYLDSVPTRLAQIAKFLGDNKWVLGNRLTYADFWLYDCLDFHRVLFNPKHLNAFPTLVAYVQRFEEVKGVKEFLVTWPKMPTHAPGSLFGATNDYKPTD